VGLHAATPPQSHARLQTGIKIAKNEDKLACLGVQKLTITEKLSYNHISLKTSSHKNEPKYFTFLLPRSIFIYIKKYRNEQDR
jgi:hypothetical protein